MSDKPTPKSPGRVVHVGMNKKDTGELHRIGGSRHDRFNNALLVQAIRTQWEPSWMTDDNHADQAEQVARMMMAFKPADEIEGMLAAQAVALHGMTMEMSRRAMLADQPSEIAHGMRKAAVGASRQFAELLTALDRKRGKGGQQKVTVEHVHVYPGGQAIVGNIEPSATGGGVRAGSAAEPHAPPAALAHDPAAGAGVPPVRSANPKRCPVPIASDAERPMQTARRRQHRS